MAELKNYDVYLNGKGYMLARDNQGNLLAGAYAEKHSDPFMRYVSTEKRWAEVTFRFSDGAGAEKFDGSNRYRWGRNIDTRSGNLLRGPAQTYQHSYSTTQYRPVTGETITSLELSNAAGADEGYAVLVTPLISDTVITVAFLVKRKSTRDYNGAAAFTVAIWDTGGTPAVPTGAALSSTTQTFTFPDSTAAGVYGIQPWENDEYFWVYATLSVAVTAGTSYWVGIQNNQAYELYWARTEDSATFTLAKWNGAAWTNVGATGNPYFYLGYLALPNQPALKLYPFRGADGESRMYALTGTRVRYEIHTGTNWLTSLAGGSLCQDMIQYGGVLYVALGLNADMQSFTGATATTVWAAVTNQRATRFAVHDNLLWKIGGVSGTTGSYLLSAYDGSTWGATVAVGSAGTAVTAMVSHGGKLYCAKEEGIYEINYEDTYPTSGSVTANLVLDFSTDCALRPWILDWHGGLYFPGNNAVYEWKNGVLRDIWNDRVDPDVQESTVTQQAEVPAYTTRKRNAPVATFPSTSRGVFHAAIGTTRGLFVSVSSPHLYESQIWCFNLNGWHPMGPLRAKSGEDPLTAAYLGEYISALCMRTLGPSEDRLYFAHGQAIGYFRLPGWTSDASQYDDATYQAAWEVELPLFDADEPKIEKYFHSIEVVTKNIASNPCVIVGAQVDVAPDTSDRYISRVLSDGPVGEVELGVVGRNIRIRLQGRSTDDITTGLIVESVTLKYHMLPDTVSTYSLLLAGATNQEKIGGGVDTRTAKTINQELKALLDLKKPWIFTNPFLEREYVMALGVDNRASILKDRSGHMGPPLESLYALTLIKMKAVEELLANGHFEANIDNWDYFGIVPTWSAAEGYPLPGSMSWPGGSGLIGGGAIYQRFACPFPGKYVVSLWAKSSAGPYSGLSAGVSYLFEPPGAEVVIDNMIINITETDTWQYFEGELDLPDGILQFYVGDGGTTPTTIYVDAVSLIAA